MKNHCAVLLYSSIFLCATGAAWGNGQAPAGSDAGIAPAGSRACMESHYPNFKGIYSGSGYMPGALEQEAICRAEFSGPDSQLAREEVKGDDKRPVTQELRKLWLMDRIQRRSGEGGPGAASVFSRNVVRRPSTKYLGVTSGAKPGQVPHLDTEAKRERGPDLLRTLDAGKADRIYYFRRTDEKLPAVCIEPGEGDVCREIVAKGKYEEQMKKNKGESGFKRFLGKVKDTVAGPSVKEIAESRTVDFFGVRLTDVAYAFDYELTSIGFSARVATRKPFVAKELPQYIRDVFGALITEFGEPALKGKETSSGKSGVTTSYAIWLTENGFRIDVNCEVPADDSGVCRDGRVAVRKLPPMHSARSPKGTEFFE